MGDEVVCFMDRAERENHNKQQEEEEVVELYEPSSAEEEEKKPECIPSLAQVVMKAKRSNYSVK